MYEERKINILNNLSNDHVTTVQDLSNLLNVSPATIRRDLILMEKSGLLKRTHGGAILNKDVSDNLNYGMKKTKNYDLKIMIAKKAAEMIDDGDIICINSSTITDLMPQFIVAKNITVVTNSLNIAFAMKSYSYCNLIVLGGTYMRQPESVEGITTVNQIKSMRFKKAFLGANGIDIEFGFSTVSELEQASKIATIQQSEKTFFVCEHTKFNRCSLHKICDISKNITLITDCDVDEVIVDKYAQSINIIISNQKN